MQHTSPVRASCVNLVIESIDGSGVKWRSQEDGDPPEHEPITSTRDARLQTWRFVLWATLTDDGETRWNACLEERYMGVWQPSQRRRYNRLNWGSEREVREHVERLTKFLHNRDALEASSREVFT